MEYSKLSKLQKVAGNKKLFAERIGMSEQGVSNMIKNRTMTVETLELICYIAQSTQATAHSSARVPASSTA